MITTVDINNEMIQLLPPHRRLQNFIIFLQSLAYPLVWNYNNFTDFLNGTSAGNYNFSTTYNIGTNVIYKFQVYQSLVNGNLGNYPDANPDKWLLVVDNFIGAYERMAYNPQKLVFEWALNHYFGTTFRQPGTGTSDIYILTTAPSYTSFVSFTTEDGTSDVFTVGAGGSAIYSTSIFASSTTYQYEIHIPVAVYTALGSASVREAIVRNFADKYTIGGVKYIIVTY